MFLSLNPNFTLARGKADGPRNGLEAGTSRAYRHPSLSPCDGCLIQDVDQNGVNRVDTAQFLALGPFTPVKLRYDDQGPSPCELVARTRQR